MEDLYPNTWTITIKLTKKLNKSQNLGARRRETQLHIAYKKQTLNIKNNSQKIENIHIANTNPNKDSDCITIR